MPNASASARASTLPLLPARAERRATASRSTFADALTFAFDVAYRAPGSLSLAQRTAYGLDQNVSRTDVSRTDVSRTDVSRIDVSRIDVSRIDVSRTDVSRTDVVRRAKLGEIAHADVVGRAKLGERSHTDVVDRAKLGERSHADVVRRAKLGETPRPRRSTMKVDRSISNVDRCRMNSDPYFRFNARSGGTEIAFVVANGRVFAGIRSWTR